jgi:hypothetical protein
MRIDCSIVLPALCGASHQPEDASRRLLGAVDRHLYHVQQALEDRLSDSGAGKHLFAEAKNQLLYLGIWPRPPEEAGFI